MSVVNLSQRDGEIITAEECRKKSSTPGSYSLFDKFSEELVNDGKIASEIASGKRFGFYRFVKDIGAGNFSKVKLAVHTITRDNCAVKILNKMKLSSKTLRLLSREISSMERLQHPHIIRLYEVMESMTKIFIVMEYAAGGELHTHITTKGRMREADAKVVFSQIISAIDHMHDKHVIHRDIKAENIFITHQRLVKIGDFGFASLGHPDQSLNTFCGSPSYAAPELFTDDYYFGGSVDIWASGVLLFFIVTGQMPFKAQSAGVLKKSIVSGNYSIPPFVSPQCCNLITNMLRQNPPERFSLRQIRDCEWLDGADFPMPFDHFEINPRVPFDAKDSSSELSTRGTSPRSDSDRFSTEELEIYQQFRHLGITDELVNQSRTRSSRSSVTGIYRIMLHQLHRKKGNELASIPIVESEPAGERISEGSKTCCVL